MEIRAEKLSRMYERKRKESNVFYAVEDVSLTVHQGELVEIIGRSGSGKSTLLNMMAGILTPTEGKVFMDETDLYALDDKALSRFRGKMIGVIPQGQTGLHSLTVLENVILPTLLIGNEPCSDERAEGLLDKVGIRHLKDVYPNELSGGEMRRLAIARALVMEPEVVLADEPTADLDDENTKAVLSLLKALAEEGKAVLLVTHEREAEQYADRVLTMNSGKLTENNRTAE